MKNGNEISKGCTLCPRSCLIDRSRETGFCGLNDTLKVARASLHFMEEPCISGTAGSGTVFFSGCNLKCLYCQNDLLSHENFGRELSDRQLADVFLKLQQAGAHNLNLVTAVMYVPHVIRALDRIRHELKIPVVYNSGGYESVETIRQLKNYVDIYLVDIKYYEEQYALRYSQAPEYFRHAILALEEMLVCQPLPVFFDGKDFDDETALLQSGVLIRHLVLPGLRKDSISILRYLAEHFDKERFLLSLLNQYTPVERCSRQKEINRRVTTFEYDSVVKEAIRLGFDRTYIQERESVGREYTPDFHDAGFL